MSACWRWRDEKREPKQIEKTSASSADKTGVRRRAAFACDLHASRRAKRRHAGPGAGAGPEPGEGVGRPPIGRPGAAARASRRDRETLGRPEGDDFAFRFQCFVFIVFDPPRDQTHHRRTVYNIKPYTVVVFVVAAPAATTTRVCCCRYCAKRWYTNI